MTVTTDDLLALSDAMGLDSVRMGDAVILTAGGNPFDPTKYAGQFVEVLAWLMKQDGYNWVNGYCAAYRINEDGWTKGHDGTPAGIMAAVTEAAVRVARANPLPQTAPSQSVA